MKKEITLAQLERVRDNSNKIAILSLKQLFFILKIKGVK